MASAWIVIEESGNRPLRGPNRGHARGVNGTSGWSLRSLATDPFGVPTVNGHQEEVKAQEDVMTNFGPVAFFS